MILRELTELFHKYYGLTAAMLWCKSEDIPWEHEEKRDVVLSRICEILDDNYTNSLQIELSIVTLLYLPVCDMISEHQFVQLSQLFVTARGKIKAEEKL